MIARLRADAEKLRRPVQRDDRPTIPRSEWPSAIAEMKPKRVYVDAEGVYVVMSSFMVSETEVYLLFERGRPPDVGTGDPVFKVLSPRVYWYEVVG